MKVSSGLNPVEVNAAQKPLAAECDSVLWTEWITALTQFLSKQLFYIHTNNHTKYQQPISWQPG